MYYCILFDLMYICSHSHGHIIVPDIALIKDCQTKATNLVFSWQTVIVDCSHKFMQGTEEARTVIENCSTMMHYECNQWQSWITPYTIAFPELLINKDPFTAEDASCSMATHLHLETFTFFQPHSKLSVLFIKPENPVMAGCNIR